MRIVKISFICFQLLAFGFQPIFAYSSGNSIVIKRKSLRKKALLDHKFVFVQEAPAFQKNSSGSARTQKSFKTDTGGLASMAVVSKIPVKKMSLSSEPRAPSPQLLNEDAYDDDNWSDYVREVEMEESLAVKAVLRR